MNQICYGPSKVILSCKQSNSIDTACLLSIFHSIFQEKTCKKLCPADESAPEVSTCQSNSDFSHPVYKEIAMTNGYINRMSQNELQKKLAELQLDTR